MTLPHICLMSRQACCLCDEAKAVLASVAAEGLCSWEEVNVDRDKALLVRYGMDVPVLLLGERELFRHRVDREALVMALQQQEGAVC